MITIKLPYNSSQEFNEYINVLRKEQSCVIRSAFNRLKDGEKQKDIRDYISKLKSINNLDSWFIQSAIYDALSLFNSKGEEKVIFGGKKSLKDYLKGLITKDQYKINKLQNLYSVGESPQKGNRKFTFKSATEIIFKPKNGIKFNITLPKTHGFFHEQLEYLSNASELKLLPISVKLNNTHIFLTFNPKSKELIHQISNRVFSIDTNPNNIGWSICDIYDNDIKVIDSGVIDLNVLNQKNTSKKHHETFEICKWLVDKAIHYKCSSFAVEDLSIKSKQHNKGKHFNKMINNDWIRNKLFLNISKRCNINNIKYVDINPAFTSIIGGTIHRDYPDPIAPTFEIARRAFFKYQKDKFYPMIPSIDILNEQWKQTLKDSFVSWREIADWLKKTKMRYRVSLDSFESKVFRMKSKRSTVFCRFLYV